MLSFSSTFDTHSFLYISSSKHKAIKADGFCGQLSWYPVTPQLFDPARREESTAAPFSSSLRAGIYKLWFSDAVPPTMCPSPDPAVLAAFQESLSSFSASLFNWRTQNGMIYTRCIEGKGKITSLDLLAKLSRKPLGTYFAQLSKQS